MLPLVFNSRSFRKVPETACWRLFRSTCSPKNMTHLFNQSAFDSTHNLALYVQPKDKSSSPTCESTASPLPLTTSDSDHTHADTHTATFHM